MNNWMVAPIMWEYGDGAKCYSAKLASLRSTNIAPYMADSRENLAHSPKFTLSVAEWAQSLP